MMTLSLTMIHERESPSITVKFRVLAVPNVTSCLNGWRWRVDAWHFMSQQRDLIIVPRWQSLTSARRRAGNLDTFDTKATLSKSQDDHEGRQPVHL